MGEREAPLMRGFPWGMKPRTCPHCSCVIPLSEGFHFDEKENLVCDNCNKIVMPVDKNSDPNGWGTYGGNYPNHQTRSGGGVNPTAGVQEGGVHTPGGAGHAGHLN